MTHPGSGWAAVLERSALGTWMRQALWAYPAAEILHLVGIALVVGSVALFDLRLLGLSPQIPVSALSRHLLPWAWRGFALVVVSGLLMFAAHASAWWANPVFPVKMGLLAAAGLNRTVFHRGVYRTVNAWDQGVPPPRAAKVSGALSLVLWGGVLACGRLLAYL
ncbi:MAG: hypothetical protein QN193_09480 [Armatimonadota bacterium]|nr:hypothetical protein [Armatimonadota bacterium]MDR7444944.1 hypothetical protein [Armatimonadota bacterium]MDR7570824.1 hypothetical protein [Armatimonadota bacterium]MDR7615121.1 hypothetical protein [Armatimonadota bacterium]